MRVALVIIAFAALVVYGEEAKAKPDAHKPKPADATQQAGDNTRPPIIVVNQLDAKREADNHASEPPSYFHELLLPQNAPTLALVIVGVLTLGAIWYQAREMTRATKEMRKSADAAERSTRAWMAGERAWILSEVHDVKVTMHAEYALPILISFDLHFKNHGRTPGRITRTSAWLDAVENLAALPLTPDYRNIETFGEFPIPVVTGKSHAMFTGFNDRFLEEKGELISQGEAIQCAYGFIEYLDIFGDPHETRFCYKYTITQPPGKPLSHGLTKWGHPEYNRVT
jgi:hypothetical protein